MMLKNKKAFFPGWEYIASFFVLAIVFVFAVGIYDFTIVEGYDFAHEKLNESLAQQGITSGEAYDAFQANPTQVHNRTLPFNMIFIFVFFYAIIVSIINVTKEKQLDPMGLIFKTIGGMIFFLWLMQIAIFKVITYFKVEIIEYLFTDLIASYVPFYLITYNNAGLIILMWGGVLILMNWYFGKKEPEFPGVFGQ